MARLSDESFVTKVDWEGGLLEATFVHGLSSDDLEDTTSALYEAMVKFDAWRIEGLKIVEQVRTEMDKVNPQP